MLHDGLIRTTLQAEGPKSYADHASGAAASCAVFSYSDDDDEDEPDDDDADDLDLDEDHMTSAFEKLYMTSGDTQLTIALQVSLMS